MFHKPHGLHEHSARSPSPRTVHGLEEPPHALDIYMASSDGRIFPCFFLESQPVNVRLGTLLEILRVNRLGDSTQTCASALGVQSAVLLLCGDGFMDASRRVREGFLGVREVFVCSEIEIETVRLNDSGGTVGSWG